jgi:protoporphyrinogen oxidase
MSPLSVGVIGAGPAGLTAAYLLAKQGVEVTVLEADPTYVGGLSRTHQYKGFRFDIGGHRFFSKSRQVENLWTELLPDDLLVRSRSSRIYYRGQSYSYPLWPREALFKLGVWESTRCMLSYFKACLFPVREPRSFEDWVTNRFGRRLFEIFFRTYTEKVWGISCKEISADWAAQRIKGLSLKTAVLNALLPRREQPRDKVIKTLVDSFRYPRLGPGMMWEACADKVRALGGAVHLGRRVVGCHYDAGEELWTVTHRDAAGNTAVTTARHLISSAPLRELARGLRPNLSEATLRAAASLKYRDFITVMLIARDRRPFVDQWIYVHDPAVKVGRVQNYKSWSPEMVPDPSLCSYGLEYFCFEGDGLWTSTDEALVGLAKDELAAIGLAWPEDVLDGCVVRQPKAYPVYDDDYAEHVAVLRREMDERFPTLHLVGRNGMHKYNNQDHAMMTAMLCVENILAGRRVYDLWLVNQDAEYHEAGPADPRAAASGLRITPTLAGPHREARAAGDSEPEVGPVSRPSW